MKKILLYTEDHDCFTDSILNLIMLINDIEVFIMTTEEKKKRLIKSNPIFYKKFTFIKLNEKISIKKNPYKRIINFLKLRKNLIDLKIDYLIIQEINDNLLIFLISYFLRINNLFKILTIHNLNEYIKVDKNLIKKYKLNKTKKYKIKFRNKFDRFIVLNNHLKYKLKYKYKINSQVIPFKLTNQNYIHQKKYFLENNSNGITKFVVPGNVESKRKDYYKIIDSFVNLDNYELIFLGKVKEKKIIDYAINKKVNLKYFNIYLNEKEFNNIIVNSHFLIGFISEKLPYGILKASGIEFDGPTLGTPVIVNSNKIISKNGLYIYTNDLKSIIKKILLDKKNEKYYIKYGKLAYEKMINNLPFNYRKNIKALLEKGDLIKIE